MSMEITNRSRELTEIEEYVMTLDNGIVSMKDVDDGAVIKVSAYLEFTDTKSDGTTAQLLSILGEDGVAYSTQSETFKNSFRDIAKVMKDKNFAIIKSSGTTKNGRAYVNCMLDKSSIK